MVSFQSMLGAKVTHAGLLNLRGPKQCVQPAVNMLRQVTFESFTCHTWLQADQRLLLIPVLRDCVTVILVSYVYSVLFK